MRRLTMIDYKSSKAIYPEYFIQLAAYGRAYNKEAKRLGAPVVERLGVLRLDKELGTPEYADCTEGEPDRWSGFCSLLQYYHVMIEPHIKEGEKARFYEVDGLRGPSVTTVLGILNKPALVQWSANMASEFIAETIDEIRNPETTQGRIDQILKKAKTAHRSVGKKATDIGQLVHDGAETYLHGGDPYPPLVGNPKAEAGFKAFLEFKDTAKLEPIHLEYQVFHPVLLYGGRVDFVGYMDHPDTEPPQA